METAQLPLDFSTRNFAYHTLENKEKKRAKVYEAIKTLGKCTQTEIAKHLGWSINRVTGRVNELVSKEKSIRVCGLKTGEFGKPVNVYEVIK